MNAAATSVAARTVAVVFARLGPYHVARLRGAAEVLGREGIALAAIAIAGMDREYAWDPVDEAVGSVTRVLFPRDVYEDIPAGRMARALRTCLSEINPLAVALPGWAFTEARAGLLWCRHKKRLAILMSESSREDHPRWWPRELLKQSLVRRFGAALVGGTRHRDYARQLGVPRAAIFTGYDAIDNDYFQQGADRIRLDAEAARKARGLPDRYLLTSCRFIPKKNLAGLLQAYALYVQRSPAARDLVICGDGALKSTLQKLAVSLQLEKRVHWPGFVQYPELPAYYALADAFILASTTEQWGLVVNEAMASGLPVLVSNRCGCSADLVREGRNGHTFDPFHVEAMAEALLKLPSDPAQLDRMGRASRQIIAAWGVRAFGEGLLEAARMVLARVGRHDFGPPGGPA
jgi:1,2-diacylglycerol 3-alpha-glucosyltransferase